MLSTSTGNPAVAAVVAETREDCDFLHIAHPEHLMREGGPRAMHQLGHADAHVGERLLHLSYVLDIEHWLHVTTP